MIAATGWTTDDLDALPEDGRRYELIDGVHGVEIRINHRRACVPDVLVLPLDQLTSRSYR